MKYILQLRTHSMLGVEREYHHIEIATEGTVFGTRNIDWYKGGIDNAVNIIKKHLGRNVDKIDIEKNVKNIVDCEKSYYYESMSRFMIKQSRTKAINSGSYSEWMEKSWSLYKIQDSNKFINLYGVVSNDVFERVKKMIESGFVFRIQVSSYYNKVIITTNEDLKLVIATNEKGIMIEKNILESFDSFITPQSFLNVNKFARIMQNLGYKFSNAEYIKDDIKYTIDQYIYDINDKQCILLNKLPNNIVTVTQAEDFNRLFKLA